MNTFKTYLLKHCIKHLIILFGFLFSLNGFATQSVLFCNSGIHTEQRYKNLHTLTQTDPEIASFPYVLYKLAEIALCLGEEKEAEGLYYLKKAADADHIAANYLLASYYEGSRTFNLSKITSNMEDINKAIQYSEKSIQMIEATSDYPEGTTRDMPNIESYSYVSYTVSIQLPLLYLSKYKIVLNDIIDGKIDETGMFYKLFYNETLDILNNIRQIAIKCLARPALDAWKEKKEIIYADQQLKCTTFLKFAEAAYPLEQQRIQINRNCSTATKRCLEHQEIINEIYQLADEIFPQALSDLVI